jgi:hypothetical protein
LPRETFGKLRDRGLSLSTICDPYRKRHGPISRAIRSGDPGVGTVDLTYPLCGRIGHHRLAPTFRRRHKQAAVGRTSRRVLSSAATMATGPFEVMRGNRPNLRPNEQAI